jgi:hypothetical protein
MTSPVQVATAEQEATLADSSSFVLGSAVAATAVLATLRASLVSQLLGIWFSIVEYSAESLDLFLEVVIPIILAGRDTSADVTLAYLSDVLELQGATVSRELPRRPDLDIRNGMSIEEVYSRPHHQLWTDLSKGKPFDLARDHAANRLRQLIETDIQLSHTHSSRSLFAERNDVVGFRRVPAGDYTCALCLIASTQRYRKMDLMPIHPGCDCRVAPIVSDEPVAQVLDRDLLESIHSAVEDMFGFSDRSGREIDYRKLVVVKNHGEIGPVLTKLGNHFTKL